MPLTLAAVLDICKRHGLEIRWFDGDGRKPSGALVRSRFEAPGTVLINKRLKNQEERLKYELAFFVGHKILHNGDGVYFSDQRRAHHRSGYFDIDGGNGSAGCAIRVARLRVQLFLQVRFFAHAFLPAGSSCAKRTDVSACRKLGVTPALVMRRMTAVSPYRHWHFFDAYAPGYLRAVLIAATHSALPWGNMSLVSASMSPLGGVSVAPTESPAGAAPAKAEVADLCDAGWQARKAVLLPLFAHARRARRTACAFRRRRFGTRARCSRVRRREHSSGGRRFVPPRRRRRQNPDRGGRQHSRCIPSAQYRLDHRCARFAGERHLSPQRRLPAAIHMQRAALNGSGCRSQSPRPPDSCLCPDLADHSHPPPSRCYRRSIAIFLRSSGDRVVLKKGGASSDGRGVGRIGEKSSSTASSLCAAC